MATVHLTFDNGPHPVGTARVLEALSKRRIRATFFALGSQLDARGGEALGVEVVSEGHCLGNHTYSHRVPLGRLDGAAAVEELERTDVAVRRVGGDRIFRPFGGGGALGPHLIHEAAARWLERGAYTCVLWDVVPRDFEDPVGYVGRAVTDCAGRSRVTMVLHDSVPEATEHLPELLDRLTDAGHVFSPGWSPEVEIMSEGVRGPDFGRYVGPVSEAAKR